MFFEKDQISFDLIDIFEMKQRDVNMTNVGRNFSALSYRFKSDACITTEHGSYRMKDSCVAYFPARLDYNRVSGVDELIVIHFNTTNYTSKDVEFFEPQDSKKFAELFGSILDVWNRRESGYRYKCSAILCEILGECYNENINRSVLGSKIQGSVDYLMQNYKKSDLSIKEIADKSFMSEVYFRKLFRLEYGVSPQKYIIRLRIQNAVGLISTGYYSLKEVAYLSGYTDYKYFSVEFKKAMGISPSDYLYNYKD